MPIRFRCAYCNQLLGIAHRKAGRVVRCPTCSGQVVVPNPDPARDEADDKDIPPNNPNLFEASDLDDVLAMPQPALASPGAVQPPAEAWGTHGEPAYAPPRPAPPPVPESPPAPVSMPPAPLVMAPAQPPGVFLSPTRATLLVVSGILGLAVAFGAGILVGKIMLAN